MQSTLIACCLSLLPLVAGRGEEAADAAPDQVLELALSVQRQFERVAAKVRPGVVCVSAYARGTTPVGEDAEEGWRVGDLDADRYPGFRRVASASGFVLDDAGTILCCESVLRSRDGKLAEVVDVETSDGAYVLCRILGTEPTLDLALLRFSVFDPAHPPEVNALERGRSEDLAVGQWVIAMGDAPGALSFFATGNLSALPGRACYQGDRTATQLQSSLTLHPQAFGGPLLDIRGRVIGIVMPAADGPPSNGLTLALPIDLVETISSAILEKQSTRSPWLGISVLGHEELRVKTRKEDPIAFNSMKWAGKGVYIDDVHAPSPAASAGIQVGDYLQSIDGIKLTHVQDFQRELYLAGIGRTVAAVLLREAKIIEVKLEVQERPASALPR